MMFKAKNGKSELMIIAQRGPASMEHIYVFLVSFKSYDRYGNAWYEGRGTISDNSIRSNYYKTSN